MCAINTFPEAGDASLNIMSTRRKCSTVSGMENSKNTFLLGRDKNPVLRFISTTPSNSDVGLIKDNVSDEYAIIPDYSSQTTSNIKHGVDYHRFPCYRIDSFQDAVLVKDVGVSCRLLNENIINSDISGIESYLIQRLKLEYLELSNITRKINAYTKDILSSLATKCKKGDQTLEKLRVASKHILTSQRADETGNPCLKLLCDETTKKYRSSKVDLYYNRLEKESGREKIYDAYFLTRDRNGEKRRFELDKKVYLREILELPPQCSDTLPHNYLIMKKEKVSTNASGTPLRKFENFISPNAYKNRNVNQSFYTTRCDPSVLTNWREISRREDCKLKNAFTADTSSKLRRAVALDSHSV